MFNLLDNALAMEKTHRLHCDPKLLEKDPVYVKYGPLGVCVEIREKYSDLVTINNWTAISAVIPEANLGEVPKLNSDQSDSNSLKKNLSGYRCYECNSEYHLRDKFPKQKRKLADKEDKGSGGNKSGGAGDNKSAE